MTRHETKKKTQVVDSLGSLYSVTQRETGKWWSRGELNPRPQAITGQIYMLSRLI